jgi:hypothetical protein
MGVHNLEGRVSRLEKTLAAFSQDLRLALRYIQPDAASSLTKSRVVLEKILITVYATEMGQGPRKPLIGDMLADNQFTRKLERRILSRMNAIRDMGNLGPHGEAVQPNDAARVLDDLCEVLDWYLRRYAENAPDAAEGVGALPEEAAASSATTFHTVLRRRKEMAPLEEEGKGASEVALAGISLISLVPYTHFFEERLRHGCTLRFLLLDPKSEALPIWDMMSRSPFARMDIERTLSNITEIMAIPETAQGKCEVRLSQVFLPFSLVAIDPDKEKGCMIVEYHTYKSTLGDRPHVRLTRSTDTYWFEFYQAQFEQLWRASTPWLPSDESC